MGGRERWGRIAPGLLVLLAGCAAAAYSPCPVEVEAPLPADAFVRCKDVLVRQYGSLAVAEAEPLRLQTGWVASEDPPGERRASVFHDGGGLAVVVELRWLRENWFGVPDWSEARGDPAAERELAGRLQEVLSPARRQP